MDKVKSLFKNKKFLIGLGVVLLIIIIAVGIFFATRKDDKKEGEKVLKEYTYSMYVKINPLVKLTFKETLYECTNLDGEVEICGETTDEVTGYELINNDAKDIYDTIDFKGKNVIESLIVLCDVARDNKVAFENIEIVTDYKFDKEEILKAIKDGSKYDFEFNIFVDVKEHMNDNEIIEDLENSEIITYTVSFDSNGGSAVEKQVVKDGDVVVLPKNPTRNGYSFVEWQLGGKKYDFNTPVEKNITLKAIWKKNETTVTKPVEKPSEKPSEELKNPAGIESTIEKINLNENIMFYYSGSGFGGSCSDDYKIFATNLEEVFPGKISYGNLNVLTQEYIDNAKKEGYWDDREKYVLDTEFEAKKSQIKYDTAKENNLIKIFNDLKNQKLAGIDGFYYSFNNHMLTGYSYGSIDIVDRQKFVLLNAGLEKNQNFMQSKMDSAVKGMTKIVFLGGCGSGPEEVLLTEETCKEYNLNCARW